MARKKKLIKDVQIFAFGHKGKALGRTPQGEIVLLENAAPGDVVDMLVLRKKKGLKWGVVAETKKYSEHRITPACPHFGNCGGCKWQHISYDEQLRQKQNIVNDALTRIAKTSTEHFDPIIPADNILHYRNKMEYSFSNRRWISRQEIDANLPIKKAPALGLHPPSRYDKIVQLDQCLLQSPQADQIRNFVYDYAITHHFQFYDFATHTGELRTLVIRNTRSGDYQISIVFKDFDKDKAFSLLDALDQNFNAVKSLYYLINTKQNDSLLDQNFIHYKGQSHIFEQIDSLKFAIHPKSFFQTNSYQAEKLYRLIKSYAKLEPVDTLYDLYSGTGSIGLYLADSVHQVVGIESVAEAVKDAVANAQYNGIKNAVFYTGDVLKIFNDAMIAKHGRPSVIVLDPPRGGIHTDSLHFILTLAPNRIIYVSCNPATQARDLQTLLTKYRIAKTRAVDMFPQTNHVENVILLVRQDKNPL